MRNSDWRSEKKLFRIEKAMMDDTIVCLSDSVCHHPTKTKPINEILFFCFCSKKQREKERKVKRGTT